MAATRSPLPPRPTSGGPIVVFFLMAFMAVANLVSALTAPADAIDHDRARGLRDGGRRRPVRPALRLPGAAHLPSPPHLRRMRRDVLLRQRGDAAAGRP